MEIFAFTSQSLISSFDLYDLEYDSRRNANFDFAQTIVLRNGKTKPIIKIGRAYISEDKAYSGQISKIPPRSFVARVDSRGVVSGEANHCEFQVSNRQRAKGWRDSPLETPETPQATSTKFQGSN